MLADTKSRLGWGGRRVGAGRPRQAESSRSRRRNERDLLKEITAIRDSASDVAKDNIKNWKSPVWASWELHSHKIQQDLDGVVEQLDGLIREWREWKSERRSA